MPDNIRDLDEYRRRRDRPQRPPIRWNTTTIVMLVVGLSLIFGTIIALVILILIFA